MQDILAPTTSSRNQKNNMEKSKIHIGGLPYETSQKDLEHFCHGYGRIRSVLIRKGHGFVEFDDPRYVDDAVYELNGTEILGVRVTVDRARIPNYRQQRSASDCKNRYLNHNGPPTRTPYRLIVENLSSRISWQELKNFMHQTGEVIYANVHRQNLNEGIVEFASYSDMKRAIMKLDGTYLNGMSIRLIEDYKSQDSALSRSTNRTRSRSHYRRTPSRSNYKSRVGSQSRRLNSYSSRSISRSTSRRCRSESNDRSGSRSHYKSTCSRSDYISGTRRQSRRLNSYSSRSISRSPSRRSRSSRSCSRSQSKCTRSESKSRSRSRSHYRRTCSRPDYISGTRGQSRHLNSYKSRSISRSSSRRSRSSGSCSRSQSRCTRSESKSRSRSRSQNRHSRFKSKSNSCSRCSRRSPYQNQDSIQEANLDVLALNRCQYVVEETKSFVLDIN